jgi:hypothetical protein
LIEPFIRPLSNGRPAFLQTPRPPHKFLAVLEEHERARDVVISRAPPPHCKAGKCPSRALRFCGEANHRVADLTGIASRHVRVIDHRQPRHLPLEVVCGSGGRVPHHQFAAKKKKRAIGCACQQSALKAVWNLCVVSHVRKDGFPKTTTGPPREAKEESWRETATKPMAIMPRVHLSETAKREDCSPFDRTLLRTAPFAN